MLTTNDESAEMPTNQISLTAWWMYFTVHRTSNEYCTHEWRYCPSEFAVLSRTYSKIAVMGKNAKLSDHILVIQFWILRILHANKTLELLKDPEIDVFFLALDLQGRHKEVARADVAITIAIRSQAIHNPSWIILLPAPRSSSIISPCCSSPLFLGIRTGHLQLHKSDI